MVPLLYTFSTAKNLKPTVEEFMLTRRFVLLGALLAVALTGCDRKSEKSESASSPQSTSSGNKGTIGVSVMTLTNPFFKIIGDTITRDAQKQGYDVVVFSGEDAANQHNQVKDFIVRKCVAIVLCPWDSQAIGPAIREANAANIPVFTADLGTLDPGAKVVSHVATDNLQGGKLAGKAMIECLGEAGGKVLVLHYRGAESCLLRVQGFTEVINNYNADPKRKGGKIEIVAELPCEGKTDLGYKSTEDAMQSNPDIAGIFAINDPAALGARAALEKANKADRIKIVGFDGMPDGKRAIKEGKIYADPVQFPERIASMTVEAIVKYFKGEAVKPVQLIPTELYRQADAMKDASLK